MHYRTHIVDACCQGVSVDGTEAYEIADCGLSSTIAAIKNSKPLLDWKEYNHEF